MRNISQTQDLEQRMLTYTSGNMTVTGKIQEALNYAIVPLAIAAYAIKDVLFPNSIYMEDQS